MGARLRRLTVSLLLATGVLVNPVIAQQRGYTVALGFPFPPWDVGPLTGFNTDLLRAVCAANRGMRCHLVDLPNGDCVGSDAQGRPIIGPALVAGHVDGCMGWLTTDQREELGAEFSRAYSFGPTPQLIARDGDSRFNGLAPSGSIAGARVGFLGGFFSDPACLVKHYTGFSPLIFSTEQAGQQALVAALLAGSLDLVFWDNIHTVPAGAHVVGSAIEDCGPHLALIVYPPRARGSQRADELRRDFNCGLALVRDNGVMAGLCAGSRHPGGDPQCILDGPPPTQQCRAEQEAPPTPSR